MVLLAFLNLGKKKLNTNKQARMITCPFLFSQNQNCTKITEHFGENVCIFFSNVADFYKKIMEMTNAELGSFFMFQQQLCSYYIYILRYLRSRSLPL